MTETRTTQASEAETGELEGQEPVPGGSNAGADTTAAGRGATTAATGGTAPTSGRTGGVPADATSTSPGTSPAASRRADATTAGTGGAEAPLFGEADAKDLQARWQAIQVGFVDEPRGAVQQADQLVDDVMRRLAESFTRERQELERAWSGGDEASTEDLRQAIRRYRSFFNRLLAL